MSRWAGYLHHNARVAFRFGPCGHLQTVGYETRAPAKCELAKSSARMCALCSKFDYNAFVRSQIDYPVDDLKFTISQGGQEDAAARRACNVCVRVPTTEIERYKQSLVVLLSNEDEQVPGSQDSMVGSKKQRKPGAPQFDEFA